MINLPLYLKLAHSNYHAMQEQERNGVYFDQEGAKKLYDQVNAMMAEIEAEVEPQLPSRKPNKTELAKMIPPKKQFKKDGTPSAICERWFDKIAYFDECQGEEPQYIGYKGNKGYRLPHHEPIVHDIKMKLKHQQALKDWLLSLGWSPTLWNYRLEKINGKMQKARDSIGNPIKTSPKFQENGTLCPNLEALGDKVEIVKQVTKWLSLRNRRSVIWNPDKGTGWLEHPRLKVDGRLPAASSGLTNTKRQKHKGVANIPRVSSFLGKEMRALFCAPEGKVLVGYDASGLEARVKGHYTAKFDGGEYARKILSGDYDEHEENAALWDCTRSQAKTPGYALQYFCGVSTFCKALGVSKGVGQAYYDRYWEANWALKKFDESVERFWKANGSKYVLTIDESRIYTRSRHSITNSVFQSTGAKIMDMAGHLMRKSIREHNILAKRVVYYHDEYIWECNPEDAELVLKLGVKSIIDAGKFFKLNVPLDADGHIGKTWGDVH